MPGLHYPGPAQGGVSVFEEIEMIQNVPGSRSQVRVISAPLACRENLGIMGPTIAIETTGVSCTLIDTLPPTVWIGFYPR